MESRHTDPFYETLHNNSRQAYLQNTLIISLTFRAQPPTFLTFWHLVINLYLPNRKRNTATRTRIARFLFSFCPTIPSRGIGFWKHWWINLCILTYKFVSLGSNMLQLLRYKKKSERKAVKGEACAQKRGNRYANQSLSLWMNHSLIANFSVSPGWDLLIINLFFFDWQSISTRTDAKIRSQSMNNSLIDWQCFIGNQS